MKGFFKYTGILLILIISFSSCKKYKQDKLVGKWDHIELADTDKMIEENWVFDAGNKLTIELIKSDKTIIFSGGYLLSQEIFSGYFISNLE